MSAGRLPTLNVILVSHLVEKPCDVQRRSEPDKALRTYTMPSQPVFWNICWTRSLPPFSPELPVATTSIMQAWICFHSRPPHARTANRALLYFQRIQEGICVISMRLNMVFSHSAVIRFRRAPPTPKASQGSKTKVLPHSSAEPKFSRNSKCSIACSSFFWCSVYECLFKDRGPCSQSECHPHVFAASLLCASDPEQGRSRAPLPPGQNKPSQADPATCSG